MYASSQERGSAVPTDPFGRYRDAWARRPEAPPATTLYRAASAEAPYFGRGSYWTRSLEFARLFRLWLDSTVGGDHKIYRAEVDLTGVHEIVDRSFSDIVTASVPLFADEGHQWLSFLERGSLDGITPAFAALVAAERQYVYLGAHPIVATRWPD